MKPKDGNSHPRLFFYCLAACLFFVAPVCLNAQNDSPSPPKGVIVDSVLCIGDTTESYCLYLPENYTPSAEWPVVLIFDPGARGRIAIGNFIPAAKKYGYILACSNNVRNGIFSTMLSDAGMMYRDVLQRFHIDKRRIFTAGFSGASRLAVGFAINNKAISGVIGCGAGLPNSDDYTAAGMVHLLYFGIAGIKDMNYLEMSDLDRILTKTGIPSYFLVFNGGHEWPSDRSLEFALGWLEFRLMSKEIIEKRDDFLHDFSLEMIDKNDANAAFRKESEGTYNEELLMREKFERAFIDMTNHREIADSTINWWKNEIHLLNEKTEGKSNSEAFMASRLLNWITSASIEYGKEMLSTGNYRSAAGFFNIWVICEPEKKFSWYNLARTYAFGAQNDRAVAALRMSVIKGFTDKKYITSDPAFNSMLNDEKFIELMNDIK